MDRGLYVAMTGAKQIMQAQAVNNHNIANINTVGFRADAVSFESQPIYGPGYATRVNAVASDSGTDFSSGVMQGTGRDPPYAIQGACNDVVHPVSNSGVVDPLHGVLVGSRVRMVNC